jgi:hypothetical protein
VSSPRLEHVAALAVLVALSGACVKQDAPGVAIEKLQSDIVFQAAADVEAPAAVPVPNVSDAPVQPSFASSDVELEFPPEPPRSAAITTPRASVPTVTLRAPTTCAEAAINEFPDEVTPLNVPTEPEVRLPKEGLYRWKKSGEAPSAAGVLPITGFERRVIQGVQLLQEDEQVEVGGNVLQRQGATFKYEVLQPDLRTGAPTLTTYVVKTNGQVREQDPPVQEIGGGGAITAGEPERGVVIDRIEAIGSSADRDDSFNPQTGLLLLPLRVRAGERFQSVAIDPSTGQTLRLTGEVRQQERIDACGEILEGWRVNSVIESSTSDGPIVYNYIIAPQFGAVLIEEQVERSTPDGVAKLRFTLGQRDPSPVTPQEEGTE